MKIYTKTGDAGQTSLYTGERVDKDSLRVEAYGTMDELDAALGMARSLAQCGEVREAVFTVQRLLPRMMADTASLGERQSGVTEADIAALEGLIDCFDAQLPPLTKFVIPGDDPGSAALHAARTVARRAERALWRLSRQETVEGILMVALNRVSDLCFVLSRMESKGE